MHKNFQGLPEVFRSDRGISKAVTRGVADGLIRPIGPHLYTSNLTEPPEALVRRHIWRIIASYMPDALIADRTAIENGPSAKGHARRWRACW